MVVGVKATAPQELKLFGCDIFFIIFRMLVSVDICDVLCICDTHVYLS